MDSEQLREFIETAWNEHAMPTLIEYMAIPCPLPAFSPEWAANGHKARAAGLLTDWTRAHLSSIEGLAVTC